MFAKVLAGVVLVYLSGLCTGYYVDKPATSYQSKYVYTTDLQGENHASSAAGDEILHYSENYRTYPIYKFEYGVNDYHTRDEKSQYEEREGDVVKGEYSFQQPDGVTRTVKYTSDAENGFRADVYLDGKLVRRP